MKFIKTKLAGVYIVELEKKEDQRGFLTRWWDRDEFRKYGLENDLTQGYISFTKDRATIRGFHYLIPPVKEYKLVRVTKGSIFEVVIDLRKESKTYKKWQGFRFDTDDYKMLFILPGFAHAILTLEKNTQIIALYSPNYDPKLEGGIRFDDPNFKISWPIKVVHVSEKDKSWEDFKG